jgi:hypothetical protein
MRPSPTLTAAAHSAEVSSCSPDGFRTGAEAFGSAPAASSRATAAPPPSPAAATSWSPTGCCPAAEGVAAFPRFFFEVGISLRAREIWGVAHSL